MSDRRSRQEIFDTAYRGLASQGFVRSMGDSGCAYRGEGGRKCAIGWVMSDDVYKPSFEGLSPLNNEIEAALGISGGDVTFADALQSAHDGDSFGDDTPAEMIARLSQFAEEYSLTIPQVPA